MSTPEERIRKAVEQAQRDKEMADARVREEEAAREHTLKLLSQRATSLGEKCRVRARELADASGQRVHIFVEWHKQESMDPGFLLTIGQPRGGRRGIRAIPQENGQLRVTIFDGGSDTREFPDEAYFEGELDKILEPLVTAAAVAVAKGEEQPGREQ